MGNKEIFERMATTYDSAQRLAANRKIVGKLKEKLLAETSQQVLLDFGCGTGEIGLQFVSQFRQVIFLDQSPKMLAVAEEKLSDLGITNGQTIVSDGSEQSLERADYIIVSQVLLHVQETATLLAHLVALLKPKGTLLIVDFVKNKLVDSDKIHNGFEPIALSADLAKLGLTQLESEIFEQETAILMGKPASLFILAGTKG